jgi:DNA helicase-2/ATP-dependent DNA helicase PcrA
MQLPRYRGDRASLKRFVVLYRTNAQSRALEEACLRTGLPYQLVGALRFYERREVKDVLSYLRLVLNPADGVSFERAILSSPRGVGLSTVEQVLQLAQSKKVTPLEAASLGELKLAPARQEPLLRFISLIHNLNQGLALHTVSDLIDAVAHGGGLLDHLRDGTSQGEARLENIEELKTVAEERSPGKGQAALERFLTDVSLWQDQDTFDEDKGGLTLMTVHAAKGLEFDTVFVVGMEEGLFPHTSSLDDPKELEEERRLAYVALTRARHKVYCIYATNRRLFGSLVVGLPSRFLGELPAETVEVQTFAPF